MVIDLSGITSQACEHSASGVIGAVAQFGRDIAAAGPSISTPSAGLDLKTLGL